MQAVGAERLAENEDRADYTMIGWSGYGLLRSASRTSGGADITQILRSLMTLWALLPFFARQHSVQQ
jgi:hypothetical protein